MRSFSITGLMALVLLTGLAVAALRNTWVGTMLLVTLGVLGGSILGAIYRRGPRRAFWQGFALFGLGYLVLASRPQDLPTGALLDALYARVSPREVVAMDPFAAAAASEEGRVLDPNPPPGSAPAGALASDAIVAIGTVDQRAFQSVGHLILTLLAALSGGLVGRWFYRTNTPA
jgi:hypothetical protein